MKNILISGAGSGLGQSLALQYAGAGNHICVVDVNPDSGKKVVEQIKESGGKAFFVECDISVQTDVEALTQLVSDRWKSLDMLVNNAGVAGGGLLEYESMDQWEWGMNINFLGHVRMTKALVPLIKQSEHPERTVIYTASTAGITASAGMASYSASKAAIYSLAETMYLELAPTGIHVSVACPSFFRTNLYKSMRTEQPGMTETIRKLIKEADFTADEIASIIIEQVADKKFMILTHEEGKEALSLKHDQPIDDYMEAVLNKVSRW